MPAATTRTSLTVPQSPSLSYKSAPRRQAWVPEPEPIAAVFKAQALPKTTYQAPAQKHAAEAPTTVPKPFALASEARGAQKRKEFDEQLYRQQQQEEMAHEVRANPISHGVPLRAVIEEFELTEPVPFKLAGNFLHEQHKMQMEAKKKQLEEEDAAQRAFKARPVVKCKPVDIEAAPKIELTETREFTFNSDTILERNKQQRQEREERRRVAAAEAEQQQEEKMEAEKQELRKLRATKLVSALPRESFAVSFAFLQLSYAPLCSTPVCQPRPPFGPPPLPPVLRCTKHSLRRSRALPSA